MSTQTPQKSIEKTSPNEALRRKKISKLPRETHSYFLATQFHPEFKSRPNHAHPLFAGLIEAALARQSSEGAAIAQEVSVQGA